MEWRNELALKLIDEYEKFPVLWNRKHPSHFNRNAKVDAWDMISQNLNIDVSEVKQKINSLLGSLRREKAKGKKIVETGKGAEEIYISQWFAFKRFQFLLKRNDPVGTVNTSEGNSREEEDDSEDTVLIDINSENQIGSEDATSETTESEPRTSAKKPKKRKKKSMRNDNDARREEAYRILKETIAIPTEGADQYSIYGIHVANKLRAYSQRARVEVENAINQILYAADIGKYDDIGNSK